MLIRMIIQFITKGFAKLFKRGDVEGVVMGQRKRGFWEWVAIVLSLLLFVFYLVVVFRGVLL